MPIEEARSLVRDTIDADHRLHTLSGMLQLHDDQESNVIQVKGMTCVGVPIGAPDFVTAFVKSKTAAMVDDVHKLQVLSPTSASSSSATIHGFPTSIGICFPQS